MKRWLVILFLLVILVIPSVVQAQSEPPQIEKMEVEILPEYDRPDVLVIYHITLASKVNLPAQLTFQIPKEAGQPYNVAMKDVDGQLYLLNSTTEVKGDWLLVTLTTPLPEIQIEYYDPRVTRSGSQRKIEYTWSQDLNVTNLSFSVLQPVNATNMKMEPDMGSGRTAGSNLTKYELMFGEIKTGSPFHLSISYDKTDDSLSVPSQPIQPAAPISDKTSGWVTLQEVLPWLLGGIGLLLIGGGGFWYWRSGREFSAPSFRRRHEPAQAEGTVASSAEGVFCHKCGRKATVGDIFCRTCGTKLRAE